MPLFGKNAWRSKLKKWILYGFITLIIAIAVAVSGIISYTNDSAKDNNRRVLENSLWNALQLQIQSYRFLNYLIDLEDSDYPLNGNALFEYDLLMSRVDLLTESRVGSLIRSFEEGRIVKLMNIANGELELLSFNVSQLENGDTSYLPNLISRIQRIEKQINELMTLINKGNIEYKNNQNQKLKNNLNAIELLSIILLTCLLLLCFFTVKILSELKVAINDNEKIKEIIQTNNEDKANILSFIHQEVRYPINAILSIAKSLKSSKTNHSPMMLSKNIEESGLQLLQTIEMVSDLALIEAHKLTLSPTTEHLQNNIESCISILEPQMSRKGLQNIVYIDPMLPAYVSFDFVRVKEIITALLQNAIIHSPTGSISVQIRSSLLSAPLVPPPKNTQEVKMLQIAIKDTGQGMSNQSQQKLRINPSLLIKPEEPIFSKVDLNLALCHKLIHLMKGEMHFSCIPQKGCEFWLNIPFHITSNNNEAKLNTNIVVENKRKALLIETDKHLAQVIALQLAVLNIEVLCLEEVNIYENKYYDLIILGNITWFEHYGHEAIQQWSDKGFPILSYFPQAIKEAQRSITPLYFPLVQSQLEKIIYDLFSDKESTQDKDT